MKFDDFYPPEGAQNDPKSTPRGSKRPFFSMLIFDLDFGAFWGRFGDILGSILAPKNDPKNDQKNDAILEPQKALKMNLS